MSEFDQWRIWVDKGGTFTDIVAQRPDGTLVTTKLLSDNPSQYDDSAVHGVRQLLGMKADTILPDGLVTHIKMGTTVATNALLERQGERVLLVTSKGFGDALEIGYQTRPDLFALDIELPTPLYEHVLEADERLDASGKVLTKLDVAALRPSLEKAYANGIRSVAVTFMHSYLNPHHELQVGHLCEHIGFTQISLSHQASPLIKMIARGDTAVVDAYLSPVLRRYVDKVSNSLRQSGDASFPLLFMQSNGGLTKAESFRGKDAILSGPAGGVVGMVKTAASAGFDKLVGFDMGGTSTDVSHYDGQYERSFEAEVSGVRVRAPMMSIHTVAAGGGSVLDFDGARLRVGPKSAGANPGPASYRNGGPLTVTDANVFLGRIQAKYFPKVFGKDGHQGLDREVLASKFGELAKTMSIKLGRDFSAEEVAASFLRVAVENMANAVKKISVQRGYDLHDYTLCCLGGASGQHACKIADNLGVSRVYSHPYAGVLSAYGIGLAEIRAIKEAQVNLALDDATFAQKVHDLAHSLTQDARQEVLEQGIDASKIKTHVTVYLKYAGTDTSLPVKWDTQARMQAQFEHDHDKQFGFIVEGRTLLADSASAEAVGADTDFVEHEMAADMSPAKAVDSVALYHAGAWLDIPLYIRDQLAPGQRIEGPCLVSEPTGTVVVDQGWRASLNTYGHMIIERYVPLEREKAIGTQVDPMMLEVFNNRFMSIAEQMGVTLANTAYSVNIKERLDFSCALFDANGSLVANAPHVPVHLGSMGEAVKSIITLNRGDMHPGDSFAVNDPYHGGTHLPDVTVVAPVFDREGEKLLFFVASRGHHADIGGKTPGSSPPDSTYIEEEGVLIASFKLTEHGHFREQALRELLASGEYPCRNIDQNVADLVAQIAANKTGEKELLALLDQFGSATVNAYMQHVQDNAEASVRHLIGALKDCHYTYELDNGAHIKVAIHIDQKARSATIDFTGTSPQQANNYNAPLAVTRAAVLYVFRVMVKDKIPLNDGCMKPLEVIVPQGSMLAPDYPAAIIAGNTEVSQAAVDTLFAALGVVAGSQGTMNNFVYGDEAMQNYETIAGGAGAGPGFHGASAVQTHMTNTKLTDPEVLELRYPVRLDACAIRRGSGGRGQFNGGDGMVRKLRFLRPMLVTTLSSHRRFPPQGLAGGGDGACGNNSVVCANGEIIKLAGNDQIEVGANDVYVMQTPGGGGYGKPE